MRALKLKMVGSAIVLAAALAPAVQAQDVAEVKRLTIMTFTAPVQLPGVTLPAGKYRFEMADINNAAHTVRVLNEDGTKVLGTFSTIPTTIPTRDLRDTDTLVMWAERPAGQPQAAKEWYYPQRSIGEEFVYPKAQALAIAAANRASVPSEDNGKIVRVEGEGVAAETAVASTTASETKAEAQVAENRAPAPAPAPAPAREPAPTAVGTSGQAPAPTPAPAPAPERTLPRTASQLGLFGLLSGLSLAAAFGVRRLRIRAARG
jgi:hypothetical protein